MRRITTFRPAVTAAGMAVSAILAGCQGPSHHSAREPEPVGSLPSLTVEAILAPVRGDGYRQLDDLRDLPETPTVRLRRAYIWSSTGGQTRALRELNRIIFGEPKPTRSEMAFARYLRANAYKMQGDSERFEHDLVAAAELATDSGLLRQIAKARPKQATSHQPHALARVLPRTTWGAQQPRSRRMSPMTQVHRLTIHHSTVFANPGSQAHAGRAVRSIQKTHMNANEWADIGYHYLIDWEGRIWTGREPQWQGAHAGNTTKNRGNLGICLLGNFMHGRGGQRPSQKQLASLGQLVADLCGKYHISPTQILTHRELNATECPGPRLQSEVDRLRQSLVSRAGQHGVTARTTDE